MEIRDKMRAKLQAIRSDVKTLEKLPQIASGFYVLIIDDGWPTVASRTLMDCTEPLAESLDDHAVIIPGPYLRPLLSKRYGVSSRDHPTLILTDVFPAEFDPSTHSDRGLKVSLVGLSERDKVVEYVRQVSETINESSFLGTMTWFDRRKRLARALGRLPVLELVGLAVGGS